MAMKMVSVIDAEFTVRKIMLGAQLVRISARSMVVDFLFETDKLINSVVTDIALTFSVRARVLKELSEAVVDDHLDFHQGRAGLMASAYELLGEKISEVKLFSNGSMGIYLGPKIITLYLDDDDLYSDDSVWDLTVEGYGQQNEGLTKHVACAPGGGQIFFYVARYDMPASLPESE